jgi:hypothetical protein
VAVAHATRLLATRPALAAEQASEILRYRQAIPPPRCCSAWRAAAMAIRCGA